MLDAQLDYCYVQVKVKHTCLLRKHLLLVNHSDCMGNPVKIWEDDTRNKQHKKAVTYLPLSKNRIWFRGKWLMIKHREQNPNEKCNYRYYIDIWKVFQAIPLKLSKKIYILLIYKEEYLIIAKNTIISPNFLVWKFCGMAQFPHNMPKLCISLKFPAQKIRWNYGIFHSVTNLRLIYPLHPLI